MIHRGSGKTFGSINGAAKGFYVMDTRKQPDAMAAGDIPGQMPESILQTAGIYSDTSGKIPGWRSAVGLYDKFNRCAV
jgi:hypothetical protein